MPDAERSSANVVRPERTGRLLTIWLLLAGGAIVASFYLDPLVGAWVKQHQLPWLTPVARWVSQLLDWPGLMAIALVGLIYAWKRSWKALAKILIAMAFASTLAGIVANSSRLTTGRTRPRVDDYPQGWYGPWNDGKLLIGKSKFNSFPSGHTATAVGFAGIMLFTRRHLLLGIAVNLGALLVAWSRVQLGAHYFSDVITGTAIGVLVALWVWRTQQDRVDRWSDRWLMLRRRPQQV